MAPRPRARLPGPLSVGDAEDTVRPRGIEVRRQGKLHVLSIADDAGCGSPLKEFLRTVTNVKASVAARRPRPLTACPRRRRAEARAICAAAGSAAIHGLIASLRLTRRVARRLPRRSASPSGRFTRALDDSARVPRDNGDS